MPAIKNHRKKSFHRILLGYMISIGFISILSLGYLSVSSEWSRFEKETKELRIAYLEDQKKILKKEVNRALNFVLYRQSQAEKQLQNSIRTRVYEAYSIAENIYEKEKTTKSPKEIENSIREALRPIRFNKGRGYYFAFNMDGVETLFPIRPEMEGKDMLLITGGKGEFVVRDMLAIIKEKSEGYYQYTWAKPSRKGSFPKVTFVKLFKPLGWVIGTGEYLDDVEKDIQEECIAWISKIEFDKGNYVFAGKWDGESLSGPATGKNMYDVEDVNGVKIVRELIKMAKTGGGFVHYVLPKFEGKKQAPKVSYAAGIPEWQWYVGAGVYLDDIETAIARKQENLNKRIRKNIQNTLLILISLLAFIGIVVAFLSTRIRRNLSKFETFFKVAASQTIQIQQDEIYFSEFSQLAESANDMVDKRWRAEETLKEREERLNILFEKAADAIYVSEPDGQLIKVNQQACRLTGYTKEELLRLNVADIDAETTGSDALNEFFRTLSAGESTTLESRHCRKNGTTFPVEITITLIHGHGRPQILGIARDITARKQSEEALRKSEALLKLITEHTSALVSIHDAAGNYIFASPSHEQLGFKPEDLIGQSGFALMEEKDTGSLLKYLDDAQKRKISKAVIDYRLKDREGRIHYYRGSFDAVLKSEGSLEKIICVGEDITELRNAQSEKVDALSLAAETEKLALVGQIAGKMAHDFNNILGVVMGNAELALLDCPAGQTRKTLELIFEQTIRGRNLTKNLVAFAKDQEPKQEFFSINEKIELVINLLKKDLEGIHVNREYGHGLPEVLADPGMIEHAIVNLVQNSVHAISLVQQPEMVFRTYQQNQRIFIEIEDNGCGIPQEFLRDIFEPSFTLKGSKDKKGMYKKGIKGTGYGMSNVKKYIEQHKGNILIDSELHKGTKVAITLPVIKKELTIEEIEKVKKEKLFFEKQILLVEDEPSISDVQHRILTHEPCHHKVDIAGTGKAAIDLLRRNSYDLVSLDYIIPGEFNGMDVYHFIREINTTLPILFISGNIEFIESIKDLKRNDPYIDHLSKPCMNIDYVNSINKLFGKLKI